MEIVLRFHTVAGVRCRGARGRGRTEAAGSHRPGHWQPASGLGCTQSHSPREQSSARTWMSRSQVPAGPLGGSPSCQHLDLALGGTCRATAPTPQGCGSILLSACSSLLTRSHSSGKPPRRVNTASPGSPLFWIITSHRIGVITRVRGTEEKPLTQCPAL